MKVQTFFVLASVLVGSLAAPLAKRDTVVQTQYVNVVEVVSLTSTVYAKSVQTQAAKDVNMEIKSTPTFSPAVSTSIPPRKHHYSAPPVKKLAPQTTTSVAPAPTPEIKQKPITTTAVQPTTTTSPSVKIEAPTTTSVAPVATYSKAATPNVGTGGSKAGQATFYDTGSGSCGKVNSSSDMIVAISKTLMDAAAVDDNPNNNPLCGKQIKCTRGDKSVLATVVDRCEGCAPGDLDFSKAAFEQLATMDEGRVQMTWEWA